MSHMGQTRQFDDAPITSDLPPSTDIATAGRHFSNVPGAEALTVSKERRIARSSQDGETVDRPILQPK